MSAMVTQWYGMKHKPVRQGKYQAREKGTGFAMDVYWRKLDDTETPDWYFYNGIFGPFRLWEAASNKMTSWRGLASQPDTEKK